MNRKLTNRDDKVAFIIQTIISIPLRVILFLFVDLRVKGFANLNNIDTSHGLIFASNHNSQLDSVVIPCALPIFSRLGPVYFVALESKEYARFPIGRHFYGGWLFKILGAYSFKKGLHNYADSLVTHIHLLKSGRTVSIYPQGGIIYGNEVGEAHGGVAYLAKASDAPIVPITIVGDKNMRWGAFFTFRRRIRVLFGKPITFNEIDEPTLPEDKRYHAAAGKVMAEIGRLVNSK